VVKHPQWSSYGRIRRNHRAMCWPATTRSCRHKAVRRASVNWSAGVGTGAGCGRPLLVERIWIRRGSVCAVWTMNWGSGDVVSAGRVEPKGVLLAILTRNPGSPAQ